MSEDGQIVAPIVEILLLIIIAALHPLLILITMRTIAVMEVAIMIVTVNGIARESVASESIQETLVIEAMIEVIARAATREHTTIMSKAIARASIVDEMKTTIEAEEGEEVIKTHNINYSNNTIQCVVLYLSLMTAMLILWCLYTVLAKRTLSILL
jgi:hypothetical protein